MVIPIFERFTDRARRIVVLAQEEARSLKHNYIGTEHLLLGMIHEGEGVAALVLTELGLSLQDLRKEVEDIIGQGDVAPVGHIAFTPRAKKVMELGLREALQLGHNYVGTEHLLLGLVREGDGVAAQVLSRKDVELTKVRLAIIQKLSGYQGKEKGEHPGKAYADLMGGTIPQESIQKLTEQLRETLAQRQQEFTQAVNSKVVISSVLALDKLLKKHGIGEHIKAREELIIDLLDWKMTV